jgi:hypothetical protein
MRNASLAYVFWPLAAFERLSPRPDASNWFRLQIRQALGFGLVSALIGLAALAWPLLLSLAVSNPTAILWIYAVAIVLDCALFVVWLVLALRYSQRAARGELFELPKVLRR